MARHASTKALVVCHIEQADIPLHHRQAMLGGLQAALEDLSMSSHDIAEREQGHGPGGDLRKLLKQQLPALLRFLLGPRTNVVATQVRYFRHTHFLHWLILQTSGLPFHSVL